VPLAHQPGAVGGRRQLDAALDAVDDDARAVELDDPFLGSDLDGESSKQASP